MLVGLALAGGPVCGWAEPPATPQGVITAKEFLDLGSGTAITDLTGSPKFPNRPDAVNYPRHFEWPPSLNMPALPPPDVRNEYGIQMFGYFYPPVTGDYVFYLASDDQGRLFLSTDETPGNRKLIAEEAGWSPARAFTSVGGGSTVEAKNSSTFTGTQWPTGHSTLGGARITLVGGNAYYVEAQMKEALGGDNLAVAVADPLAQIDPALPIPGAFLSSGDRASGPLTITQQPQDETVAEGSSVTFRVELDGTPPYTYQWKRDGQELPGATQAAYTIHRVTYRADHDARFTCAVAGAVGAPLTSSEAVLSVFVDLTPPVLLAARGSASLDYVVATFSEALDPLSASTAANYLLSGGITVEAANVRPPPDNHEVALKTSRQIEDTNVTLTVDHVTDLAGNEVPPNSAFTFHTAGFATGWATYERWHKENGDPGGIDEFAAAVTAGALRFPDFAGEVAQFEAPWEVRELYYARVSGFFIPPRTADYVFFLASDDQSILYLSPDESAANKRMIARETSYSRRYEFTTSVGLSELTAKRSDQFGATEWPGGPVITLAEGERYYLEAVLEELGGSDGLDVTFIRADEAEPPNNSDAIRLVGDVIGTHVTASEAVSTFTNPQTIFIRDSVPATPYPSTISVSGLDGSIAGVTVTLHRIGHPFPEEMGVLLVSPRGRTVVLMNGAGGRVSANGVTLTFDDLATSFVPQPPPLTNGRFKPADYKGAGNFPDPAPARPYTSELATFNGESPRGIWSLYVMDDSPLDLGAIAGGWSLAISVAPSIRITAPPAGRTLTMNEDTTNTVSYVLGHAGGSLPNLTVTAASSNPAVVPSERVEIPATVSGQTAYTATVKPAPDAFGATELTWIVTRSSDGAQGEAVVQVNVMPVNDAPSLSDLGDLTIDEDTSTGALALTVADVDTPVTGLSLTGSSSNPALVPDANLVFGGADANRTLTVTPLANQSGTATITVTVSDGALSASDAFVLTVYPVNDPPSLSDLGDTTVNEDTATGALAFVVADLDTPLSLLSLTGTSGNPALVPDANIVFGGSGADRTVTVTPAANQFGTATIMVVVSDGFLTTSDTFVLTVNPVNDAPSLSELGDLTIEEDTSTGALALTVADVDTPLAGLSLTGSSSNPGLVPDASIVFGGEDANRTVTVTPLANQFGSATITVTVWDGVLSASDSFVLTVNPVNDPPSLSELGDVTINQGASTGPLPLTVADVDTPLNALTLTGGSSNPALVPAPNILFGGSGANRTVTVTPAANQSGTATITVTVSDGVLSASDSFVLTVKPVTATPSLSDLGDLAIEEDTSTGPLALTVADADTPLAALSLSGTSSDPDLVPNARILFGGAEADRTVTVIPAPNRFGTAIITVTVSDGVLSSSDSFVLTVNPVNDAPTLSGLGDRTIDEDTSTGAIGFTVADVDTPLTGLSLTGSSNNPGLVPDTNIVFGGEGADRTVTVTPAPNQSGAAIITILVSDGALTTSRSFVLTVNPVNDPPTLSGLSDQTISEDASTGALTFTVADVDTPLSGLILMGRSNHPSLVPEANIVFGGSGAERTLTVTPAADQFDTATITVTVSDELLTTSESFVLTVTPVNDPPRLSDLGDRAINEDTTTGPVVLTVADVDTPLAGLSLTGRSSNPALVADARIVFGGSGADRTVTVTPVANQSGSTTVTVTVSDGMLSASDSFVLTVNPVNDAPTLSELSNRTINEDTSTGAIGFTVADVDTPLEGLTLSATSDKPVLVPDANVVLEGEGAAWTLTATPAADQFGSATITVTVSDGALSTSRSFVLTVSPVNDPPSLSDVGDQTIEEDASTDLLPVTVADLDTPFTGLSLTGRSSNPVLVPEANIVFEGSGADRTVVVTPAANQFGTATITITVSDGSLSASDSFVLAVNPVNDLPTLSGLGDRTIDEDTSSGALAFTVADVDTPFEGLTLSATSDKPVLVPDANLVLEGEGAAWTLTATPAANQFGTATIMVTVSDGFLSATNSFVLTVLAVDDPPSLSDVGDLSIDEDGSTGPLAVTVADVDTPVPSLSLAGSSSNPALVPEANIVFGGSGADRTVTVTPAANQFGTATITVTVWDETSSASDLFVVTVNAVNDPPTIAPIGNRRTANGRSTRWIPIRLDDADPGDVGALALTFRSSDARLVTASGFTVEGSGRRRRLRITPEPGQTGQVEITVTARDPSEAEGSVSFQLTVYRGPQILLDPVGWTVEEGASVSLDVLAVPVEGPELRYQWFQYQGAGLWSTNAGATNASLLFPRVRLADAGLYRVEVADRAGKVATEVQLTVLPPVRPVVDSPLVEWDEATRTLTLRAQALGEGPLSFQWLRNHTSVTDGVPSSALPLLERGGVSGATTNEMRIVGFQTADAGEFSVVVANQEATVESPSLRIGIQSGTGLLLPISDDLPDEQFLRDPSHWLNARQSPGSTNTFEFTAQQDEPTHANRPGGSSGWFLWRGPEEGPGVATFTTAGSAFDTVLAVYRYVDPLQPLSFANLTRVVGDDDEGGFFTSYVRFNAQPGVAYLIAVDDRAGKGGNVVLSWQFEPGLVVPVIATQPNSIAVRDDELEMPRQLRVTLLDPPGNESFQWFRNGLPLAEGIGDFTGVNSPTLTLGRIDLSKVAVYRVAITINDLPVESDPALVEIVSGDASTTYTTRSKLADVFLNGQPRAPALASWPPVRERRPPRLQAPSTSAGTIITTSQGGTKIPDACGLGTNSSWRVANDLGFPAAAYVVLEAEAAQAPISLSVWSTTCEDCLLQREWICGEAATNTKVQVGFDAKPDRLYIVVVNWPGEAQGLVKISWRTSNFDLELRPPETGLVVIDTAHNPLLKSIHYVTQTYPGFGPVVLESNAPPATKFWFPVQADHVYRLKVDPAGYAQAPLYLTKEGVPAIEAVPIPEAASSQVRLHWEDEDLWLRSASDVGSAWFGVPGLSPAGDREGMQEVDLAPGTAPLRLFRLVPAPPPEPK